MEQQRHQVTDRLHWTEVLGTLEMGIRCRAEVARGGYEAPLAPENCESVDCRSGREAVGGNYLLVSQQTLVLRIKWKS